jgi:hypothetical protein
MANTLAKKVFAAVIMVVISHQVQAWVKSDK